MIYFIGAGPGDPDLITVKGKKIIEMADIIVFAGSLVNEKIISCHKPLCRVYNSASMTLEEVLEVIIGGYNEGLLVARVHTGDPSIFGAIREQIDELEAKKIPYKVIPGVSSFCAAAAALSKEFTLPNVSQTVILTRQEGRTPVPNGQKLKDLAVHKASMAIFLSVNMIDEVVAELLTSYDVKTPVAVVYKASWEDEKIIEGTLSDIAKKVKAENINKTAQILVGDFLGNDYEKSLLYDKKFSHMFRSAKE